MLYYELQEKARNLIKCFSSRLDTMSPMLMHPVRLPGCGMFVAQLAHNTTMLDMLCFYMVNHVRPLLAHMITFSALKP